MELQESRGLGLVSPDNPALRTPAKLVPVVEILQPKTQNTIQAMLDFAYNIQEREKRRLTGLAAPQLGIPECIFLVLIGTELEAFINPEIIWQSDDEEEFWEGCFSLQSDSGFICGIVSRPISIVVKAFTKDGKPFERQYNDLEARRIQHEMDHLNGNDLASCATVLHLVRSDEVEEYRKNWKNWPGKFPRELYKQIAGLKRIGESENK